MLKIIFKLIKYLNKVPFFIILLNYSINCLEKNDYQDYGIYNNVASIISANQNQSINEQFRPSNWNSMDNIRKLRKLESINKYRRYQEYRNRLKDNEDSNQNNYQNNYYSNQFKRRSDLPIDEDYYAPNFYPSSSQYGIIYPPAIQPIISLPAAPIPQTPPTVITQQPTYYRRYRPSASRNYYHRIYPNTALRRRLASAASSSSNYETSAAALPYAPYATAPTAHSSYYYGTGLATPTYSPPPSPSYSYAHAGFPNTHGLAHAAAEHDVHNERTEVHNLLPIITVIGISAFMIPLLTTFFTAMLSGGGSCCQRQKERNINSMDVKSNFYAKAKDTWNQVEKAINNSY